MCLQPHVCAAAPIEDRGRSSSDEDRRGGRELAARGGPGRLRSLQDQAQQRPSPQLPRQSRGRGVATPAAAARGREVDKEDESCGTPRSQTMRAVARGLVSRAKCGIKDEGLFQRFLDRGDGGGGGGSLAPPPLRGAVAGPACSIIYTTL